MATRNITIPNIESLDAGDLTFEYDERSDSLFIYLARPGTPGVSVALDEHLLFRVDPNSEELIGIEIEGFLTSAVQKDPRLLAFAEVAGISEQVMDRWRSSGDLRSVEAKAVRQLIEEHLGANGR